MVIREGEIIWIGESEELDGTGEDFVDLNGKRVLPGIIDAHMHPLLLANAAKQIACTPPLVYSIEELLREIKKQRFQESDSWIECWGYDEGKLKEGRAPNRYDLDKASTDLPIVVTRTCLHIVSVNSKALQLAGIDATTPDPVGGEIDRDQNGEPTGILRENARYLVLNVMPLESLEDNAQTIAELSPKLLSHGITAITDLMGRTEPIDYYKLYEKAREKGLKQRVVLYYLWEDVKKEQTLPSEKIDSNEPIHVGGVKVFTDGSISGQTAWVKAPFHESNVYGIQMTSEEELWAAARAAKQNHIQLVIHAMGEHAIDFILDTFSEYESWLTNGPSIRIEHASLPTDEAIKRAAKAGIAFVTQPIFLFAEIESYLANLGTERTKRSYPVQSMLEAGVLVAFSSDAPATAWADPANPFVGMKAAVTRTAYDGTDTGENQRIDVETAITLYTREAQQITRIPKVGQLAVGYYADFIVLDQDLLEIERENIDQICVEQTYLGGSLVYKRMN
ncbi:exoenzymes regulatory protein AepA precursor [Halalkalibacter wakoensis JCM 9140]|uniref:Exoenzymes regulatory protein AepA n=2 Tax=Halalkalibacter wakoensis TaxID=127891 RepID=W4Q3R6_9BACI|nr:exoenzymes regulatory protein AepA precursor [Halalkalibacter wakoensis JCM 9140]